MTAEAATLTLAEFLERRLDEDEAAARTAARSGSGRWGSWNRSWDVEPYRDLADEDAGERIACLHYDLDEHIARHDPARVLAEVAAKRAIATALSETFTDHPGVTETDRTSQSSPWAVLRHLATVYSDHPDYRDEWRP